MDHVNKDAVARLIELYVQTQDDASLSADPIPAKYIKHNDMLDYVRDYPVNAGKYGRATR